MSEAADHAATIREALDFKPHPPRSGELHRLRDNGLAALAALVTRAEQAEEGKAYWEGRWEAEHDRAEAAEARADQLQRQVEGLRCADCKNPMDCGLTLRPLCHLEADQLQREREDFRHRWIEANAEAERADADCESVMRKCDQERERAERAEKRVEELERQLEVRT